MTTRPYILFPSIAGLTIVLLCSLQEAFAQGAATAQGSPIPLTVERPSSPEFVQDTDKLDALSSSGDLNGLLSMADKLAKKWLVTDKLSYYCILSTACDDLTSYDFGPSNYSRQHSACEKYAEEALDNGAAMPLGMRAYFVEHFTYAPGYGITGATGEDWTRLRSQRLAQWLGVWQQIDRRTVKNFPYTFGEPQLPPREFIPKSIIINGGIDPKTIADTAVREKYIADIKKYQDNRRLAQEQRDLQRVREQFVPLIVRHIVVNYSAAPYNTSDLAESLSKAHIAPDVCAEILDTVKHNIQRGAGQNIQLPGIRH